MKQRTLGPNGPTVSAIGLGCMGMSPGVYGSVDEAASRRTIQRALDVGVTFLDTAEIYGSGHNEELAPSTQAEFSSLLSGFASLPVFVLLKDFLTK